MQEKKQQNKLIFVCWDGAPEETTPADSGNKTMEDIQQEASKWVNKPFEAKQTWIFRRGDGETVFLEEAQAWEMLKSRGEWRRKDFELIGSSDFKHFKQMISKGAEDEQELRNKLTSLREEVRRYENTFEKFKFEDLLEDNDPKIIKVNEIINKSYKEIEAIKKQIDNHKSDLHQRALDAEIEIAKNNKVQPTNQDTYYPFGRENDIGVMKK